MPHDNPDRETVEGGETVFIDAASLSELPPQLNLMQQDLESLVGLNIHTSDLESLQVSSDGQVVDTLISDGVSVGSIVEVGDEDNAMDTSDALPSNTQPMEVDGLTDSGQDLSDIDLLHHGHDFMPMGANEDLIDDASADVIVSKSLTNSSLSHHEEIAEDSAHIVGGDSMSTQILKTSTGQFVILQPNQTSLPLSSVNNRVLSSANIIFSSLSSSSGSKNTKPQFVNANQLGGSLRQISNLNQSQPQVRTLQLKQPISLSSDSQNSGVTKVILTSQPGNNLSQQLRWISPQTNTNASHHNSDQLSLKSNNSNSSKVAVQFQPVGISLSSKNLVHSPVKSQQLNDLKPTTKIKFPLTIPLKSSSPIQQFTTLQPSEISSNQILSPQGDSKVAASGNPVIIKGNIPLGPNSGNFKPGQIIATSASQLIKIPVSQLPQLSSRGQTVQLSNKQMNFRIVSNTSSSPGSTLQLNNQAIFKSINVASKPIAPANNKNANVKGSKAIPIQITHSPKTQRLIIPVSSQDSNSSSTIPNSISGIQIRPQSSITLPASALPHGVLSNAQPGSLVMIPAQYFQGTTGLSNHVLQSSNHNIPVSLATTQPKNAPTKTVIDANAIKARKPCNCTKSQCLKLYCDCFANGEFCNSCNCVNCYNNLSHEEERQKAIKSCLERNPQAFRPKIGKGGSDSERRHNKGCNCKRSGCLKNYCECYEAKIPCSNMCKCVGCRNMDSCQPYERKRLMQLAEAAEARVNQHMVSKNRPFSLASLPSPAKMSLSLNAKNTYCRISQEVVEATCHCLLAQAEKVERNKLSAQEVMELKMGKNKLSTEEIMELKVINEFSRCLLQIIGFSSKAKGNSLQ